MTDLLILDKSGEPLLDSRVAARELGVEHESVMRIIAERPEVGVEYSDLKSEKSGKRGQPAKYALLTERQALALITLVRNSEEAVAKKMQLVDAFLALRSAVSEARIARVVRREMTDALRDSGENDRMHGHAYSAYTDVIYRQVLGMDARRFREVNCLDAGANVRENLTKLQLAAVKRLEKLASSMLDLGADYAQVKAAIEGFGRKKIGDGSVEARELAASLKENRK